MSDSETRPDGKASGTEPTRPEPTKTSDNPLRGSRTSGLWFAVVASAVVLVLLIIFIAQNTEAVRVTFLGWEGETPLAVSLMAATVAGMFLAAIAGTMRILQLRRRVKRDAR